MVKTLTQLKKAGKSPEMKPVKPHGQFYEPRHKKYFEWYYSDAGQKILASRKEES